MSNPATGPSLAAEIFTKVSEMNVLCRKLTEQRDALAAKVVQLNAETNRLRDEIITLKQTLSAQRNDE